MLGGGGILGAAEVGFIQRADERGIGIDFVLGTSEGAINAAYVAFHDEAGFSCRHDIWSSLRGQSLFPPRPLRVARNLARRQRAEPVSRSAAGWREGERLANGPGCVGLRDVNGMLHEIHTESGVLVPRPQCLACKRSLTAGRRR